MSATVLIVTDVFGNTPAIASLQRFLGINSIVTSPFADDYAVNNEQQAYQAFLAAGGVQAYSLKLRELVRQQAQLRHVIGFSAGASAWWLSCAEHAHAIQSASLFYASRIRDHLDIHSACDTHFIFAEQENAYQPQLLVQALRQRGHQAEVAPGTKHGFMNPYAAGFSLKTQTHYLDTLAEKVHMKRAA
ncbi:MAG: hypothetical protein ACEQSE_06210 [Candidatus Aquirickettsiella gammari]